MSTLTFSFFLQLCFSDEENFCATVPKDGRSYSPTLFAQTVRVLKKINKPGNMIVAFSNLAERIKVRGVRGEEDSVGDFIHLSMVPLSRVLY